MPDLQALEAEFHAACVDYLDTVDDAESAARDPRVERAFERITKTPPATIGDVVVKLRMLLDRDPALGGSVGDCAMDEDEIASLRQCVAWLEDLNRRGPG